MLDAGHRLHESASFRRTVRSGRRAGGAAVVVHLALPPQDQHSVGHDSRSGAAVRVGFVVSKAVGGAVVRNRVRRRLRHLVRPYLATLPASSELVVRALPPAAGMDSSQLGAELGRCLDRVLRSQPSRKGADGGSRSATGSGPVS